MFCGFAWIRGQAAGKGGLLCAGLLGLLLLSGCCGAGCHGHRAGLDAAMVGLSAGEADAGNAEADDDLFEDYDDEPEIAVADPLEGWNRFWFRVNDFLYLDVFKPVHSAYAAVTPQGFRTGLSNAFSNLQTPIRVANSVLQGRFEQAMVEVGRFIVNSTIGLGGTVDVTKDKKVLVPVNPRGADFGQTLASWGFGEGFYIVWPILGPSTVRDTVGLVGDLAASPTFWAVEPVGTVASEVGLGTSLGLRFNDLGRLVEGYEAITNGAVEPYVAAREAYVKYRRAAVLPARIFW